VLFNDASFIPFLAFSVLLVHLTRARWRWVTLLLLSVGFYATFQAPGLLAVLAAQACIGWGIGRLIDRTERNPWRWRLFVGGTAGLLAALILVRLATSSKGLAASSWQKTWLPSAIGVSYFTLQAISYLADVYLGRMKAEANPARLATYLVLYPKLLQGPIERAAGLLQQLRSPSLPGYDGLRTAAALFGWGLFKKVVLGDRLALIVDPVFAQPTHFAGFPVVAAVYAFSFQLYFDFSGYTDMARGTARFLGIELSENFRGPYLATSVTDFWRRWHITFSRWLLDYLFTPLQLSWRRLGTLGTAAALFVTFASSGLWHGFAWTFTLWGLLHGVYLAAETLWRGLRRPAKPGAVSRLWGTLLTFHLVTFAWVFFRAPSVGVAWTLLTAIPRASLGGKGLFLQLGHQWLAVTLFACLAYALVAALRSRPVFAKASSVAAVRWTAYIVLLLAILLLRQDSSTYLYAQF